MISPTLLSYPEPQARRILQTDASDFAIGATLLQEKSAGKYEVIEFFPRKLTSGELNYTVHDKELLAIVDSCDHWRHFLIGVEKPTLVLSDHKNLGVFRKAQLLTPRHSRWGERLSEYNIKIVFVEGNRNGAADALSRRPDYQLTKEEKHMRLFQKLLEPQNVALLNQIRAVSYTHLTLPTNREV